MVNAQIADARNTLGPVSNSPGLPQASPKTSTSVESTLSVRFESGLCSLPEREIAALAHWLNGCNLGASKRHLWLGGAHETSRTNRLRRFGFLMSLLRQLGVPKNRVHAAEDWTTPIRMGSIDDVPVDKVWLQLREFPSS